MAGIIRRRFGALGVTWRSGWFRDAVWKLGRLGKAGSLTRFKLKCAGVESGKAMCSKGG